MEKELEDKKGQRQFSCEGNGARAYLSNMSARKTWWVLGLFPLVFFAVNRAWMYSTQSYPDAWMYTGYFLHPELLYPRMPDDYQGTRVLHIALGWLANRWLPVTEAIFVYKATLFYAGYLFLFGALRAMFRNERAALIGAALGLTSGLAIYNLSFNYVVSTCLVLQLGAVWAEARMRDGGRGWWRWAMLAGAFYVGAAWTYLAIALTAPLIFGLFVQGLPERSLKKLWAGLGWAALGGVLSMVAQGLISVGLGGDFWYFLPQLVKAQGYLLQDWIIPIESWWRGAYWLPYFGLVLTLACLGIWKGGTQPEPAGPAAVTERWRATLSAPLPVASLIYILGLGWFCAIQASGKQVMLQNCERASFLFPFAFLVVGGWVAWLLVGMKEWRQWVVVVTTIGGILLIYGWLGHYWPAKWVVPWVLLLIPLALAAGLVGIRARPKVALTAALVFVSSLAGLNAYLAERRFLTPDNLARNVAYDEALYGTVRAIDAWDREGRLWIWDGVDRPKGAAQREVSFFYLWNRSLLGERFPGLVGGSVHPKTPFSARKFTLRPGMWVLLFDASREEMADAQAALTERGMRLSSLAQMNTPAQGAFPALRAELWAAVPTGETRGVKLELAGATIAEGVTRETQGAVTAFAYPAGLSEPAWELELPEAMRVKQGEKAGLLKVRIGENARALRLVLTDEKGSKLEEAVVDPGTAVRDWWLELPPGADYRRLEVRPQKADAGGGFTIESVEY